MQREHQTEEALHAWLDNELGSRESEYVHEHVQSCDSCSAVLAECRETRATVSQLLQLYDGEVEGARNSQGASGATRSANKRSTKNRSRPERLSAPMISHIIANTQSVKFWAGARTLAPVAAAAVLFVGSASLMMVRSYHVVAGSVKAFANDAQRPFVDINGRVVKSDGAPIANATVSVSGTKMSTKTNEAGYFRLEHVPRSAQTLVARGIGYNESSQRFTSGDGDDVSVGVQIRLTTNLRVLNPVLVTSGDSVETLKKTPSENGRK